MLESTLYWYKQSPVSYHRFGKGDEVLVAFHGYDQTAAEYLYFNDVLNGAFTVIAIDFFWHGQSEWREDYDFTEQDMKAIVVGIKQQERLRVSRFSICSFSMGARMARALVRSFPHRINYLILLSPPTFAFNRFLNFTTNNPIGLLAFRYFVRNNDSLLYWVKRLNQWRILNRSVYIFTSKFIGHKQRMEKVYKTWYAQRLLKTNFDSFAQLLNQNRITTILIVGKHDYITPPKQMINYVKQLQHHKIFVLNKKHELATEETKNVFAELFNKQ
jgi:pimeloyl-ACP methyl ester carboxylesterase